MYACVATVRSKLVSNCVIQFTFFWHKLPRYFLVALKAISSLSETHTPACTMHAYIHVISSFSKPMIYSTFWKSLNARKLRVVSTREYTRELPSTVRAYACWVHTYVYVYTSTYYGYSINIMYIMYVKYLKLRPTAFSFSAMKVNYLQVARDALRWANPVQMLTLGRVRAYASVSVCTRVITACRVTQRAFKDFQNVLYIPTQTCIHMQCTQNCTCITSLKYM